MRKLLTAPALPMPINKQFAWQGKGMKITTSVFFLLLITTFINAQDISSGVTAITDAADGISPYFDAIETLIYIIAAIIALLGGVRVFMKWNMGDPDVMSSAAGWFGSVVFLLVSVTVVDFLAYKTE